MIIKRCACFCFRNLLNLSIDLHPENNIIFGLNGVGKSSLLEAIFYSFSGRSFRTSKAKELIMHGEDKFVVSLLLKNISNNSNKTIGIERFLSNSERIRVDSKNAKRADVAAILPVVVMEPSSDSIICGSPDIRRRFIDWWLFHVKHEFIYLWREGKRILLNRNALLKSKSVSGLSYWNDLLVDVSYKINDLRKKFVMKLEDPVNMLLYEMGLDVVIELDYYPGYSGWKNNIDLSEVLTRNLERDLVLGYTSNGYHKADLLIRTRDGGLAKSLSRGQQKALILAFKIAQGELLYGEVNKKSLYLIDDMPSEFDENVRKKIEYRIKKVSSQTIITSTYDISVVDTLNKNEYGVFKMEDGKIFC